MAKTIIEFLLKAQNFDGGWGATEGKRSNTEATAFALLGLSTCEDAALTASIQRGLSWLTTRQHADGSWSLTDQHQVGSWATTLAIIALACFEVHHQSAIRGAEWLLSQKGRTSGWIVSLLYRIAPQKLPNRLNPDLQGWSWISDTFSWVEPTAYALIALKRLRPFLRGAYVAERIQQGTLLLYDRMCDGGGWNYGNSEVFGERIPPYPEITALVLIALQDHQAKEANQVSLHALQKMLVHAESGLALSWSILCLALYGHEVSAWQERLRRNYEQTRFLGETKAIALALLALGDGTKVLRE